MNDTNSLESIQQSDITKSRIVDDIRSMFSMFSNVDSMIGSSLPQAIKNPKADVTTIFFRLIELFSTYFEKSTLPRDNTLILFGHFAILHHFAVDLYCTGISHTDEEFTSVWKNFSWIFKKLQSSLFPNDYNHAIEQITQRFTPLQPQLDDKIQEERDLIQLLKSFIYSVPNLQDPRIAFDSYNKIYSDFANLKKLIQKFCQRIDMSVPHLFNALNLTEYILNLGCLFVNIRETVKVIDSKLQESSILSIHFPIELTESNVLLHHRLLNSSIKVLQVENRLIYYKILEMNQQNDNLKAIAQKFYVATTNLMQFTALFRNEATTNMMQYRDNLLFVTWKLYIQYSNQFLSLTQKSSTFQKIYNPDQAVRTNLANEFSLINQESHIIPLYEEFIRLYTLIGNDRSHRSFHPLSRCIIILLKISNETDSDGLRISAMETINVIIYNFFISKAFDDNIRFENIIKAMNDTKRRCEQQKQLLVQQQPQSNQSQQQQIGSSSSSANIDSSFTVTQSSKQTQSMPTNTLLMSKLTSNESPYQTLVAIYYYTVDLMNTISINQARHQIEWKILSDYLSFLELLTAISAPKGNGDGNVPIELVKFHISIDQIGDCLKIFFEDTKNEILPFSATVPPIIFSSYPIDEAKLSPSDMQRISTLLLTERKKGYGAQYVALESSRLTLYIGQLIAFLEKFQGTLVEESKAMIDSNANPNLGKLVSNLLNLKKDKTFYTVEETREMSELIFPLLLKSMYKRVLSKISIEEATYRLIKSLYVPRCSELIKQCYLAIDFFDTLLNKNASVNLRHQISDLRKLFTMAFTTSIDFNKYNQKGRISKIIDTIDKEINDPQVLEEANTYLKSFDKFFSLCRIFNSISDQLNEFKYDHFDAEVIEKTTIKDEEIIESDKKSKEGASSEANEIQLLSNEPYKIPYVSILSKVGHVSLMRQKLIEGKRLNLFIDRDSEQETEQFDDFCSSLIAEIDEALITNKFIHIINKRLDDIIKKFSRQFKIQIVIKNLIYYYEEWASYIRNVNELSPINDLIIDRNLKTMKTYLAESLISIQTAPERISYTIKMIRKRSLDLQKDVKTMESRIIQFMSQNYIERATCVFTFISLIKFSNLLDVSLQSVALQQQKQQQQPSVSSSSSQQAISQLQQQAILIKNGSSSTSQIPLLYSTKTPQQQQQTVPQPQVIQVIQPFQIHQIQAMQQQQTQQSQPIPAGIQILQSPAVNQQGQFVQAAKIIYSPIVIYNPVIPSASAIPQYTETNLAFQQIREILRSLTEIPCTQAIASLIDKYKELISGSFPRMFNIIYTISPEKVSSLQLSELKTFKSNIISNLCKLESSIKRKEFVSLNEHFKRCLDLLEIQTHKKDIQIGKLRETIESLEGKILELGKRMPKDEAASPEVISALESILKDDVLTNIIDEQSNLSSSSEQSIPSSQTIAATTNLGSVGSRRREKQRGRGFGSSFNTQSESQEESTIEEVDFGLTSFSSNTSNKQSSSSVVNSLLLQVKDAEILNKRLQRKLERIQLPNCTPPLSQSQFTAAYPLNLNTCEGCSWIASNAKENASSRNELSKFQDEREELFEQIVTANASKSAPLKPETIEGLYASLISSCASASSSSTLNGKVSKSALLSLIEKSDSFFIRADYDMQIMKKKLKSIKSQNKMTPAEFIAQFTKKLQSFG